MTDANNNIWTWVYDSRNRPTKQCDPVPQCDNYQYDANSNLIKRTKYNSFSDNFTYDALNRKTFEGWAYGAKQNPTRYESTVNYTWDSGNRLTVAVDSISAPLRDAPESAPEAVSSGLLLYHPVSLTGLGPVMGEAQ